MRIGIILHPYDEDKPAGLARTIFELAKGMLETDKENEYIIYLKKQPRALPELPGDFRVEILGGGRLWLEKLRTAAKADVYIFNTPIMPLLWKPPRSIVLALDFAYWYLAEQGIRSQIAKWATFLLHKRALRHAETIVAISQATKKDVLNLFKIPENKIKVIYCGFKRMSNVREVPVPLPQKFFFFAGIIKHRKNVFSIVRAFHLFSATNPGHSLVIGGNGSGKYYETIRKYVLENHLEHSVLFIGHLNDHQLSYAYKRALMFIFPTLIEGFGYPVLEAMECGIPVITSNQSSLAEVGGDAALLVNPYDIKDIAVALERIAREPRLRDALIARGRAHTERFSWEKAAREMVQEAALYGSPRDARGEKKTIFITVSRGLLVRNFFRTGVVARLIEKGFRVVALVPNDSDTATFREFLNEHLIFEKLPPPSSEPAFKKILNELSKGAVFNSTVRVRYQYQYVGKIPSRSLFFARMLFVAPLRFLPGIKRMVRALEYRLYPERECDFLFEKYAPALVFNTAMGQDFAIMKAARRFHIPTVGMPKSWDSSSKALCRVKADHMLAWGPFMREQLLRFQRYAPRDIIITGAPQFDVYAGKSGLQEREAFCKKIGLDAKKKIILYISTGMNRCDETEYLELIRSYMASGALMDCQVLIRPHVKYADDEKQYLPLEKYETFFVDKTVQRGGLFRDNWDTSEEHLSHLLNSLHHADIVVNIGSTMILDASLCGTPSINIAFDVCGRAGPHRSARRLLVSDYIATALRSGGAIVVSREEAFLPALEYGIARGRTDKKLTEGRRKMVEHIAYRNDGKAAMRVVDALVCIANGYSV